jgi:hypothetical protein
MDPDGPQGVFRRDERGRSMTSADVVTIEVEANVNRGGALVRVETPLAIHVLKLDYGQLHILFKYLAEAVSPVRHDKYIGGA